MNQDHRETPDETELPSAWAELFALMRQVRYHRWVLPVFFVLGLGAAVADTLSVGLAVMMLFALLGQFDRISEAGGLLAKVSEWIQAVAGDGTSAIVYAFLGLIIVNAALIYANRVMTAHTMNHVAQKVRDAVHEQYLTVSYRHLQQRDQGHLMNVLSSETWEVTEAFFNAFRIGINACTIFAFGIGMFLLSWVVGLTALACAAVGFAALTLVARPVRRYGAKTLAENEILHERMLISLLGMRTIRIFGQEDHMRRAFETSSSRVRDLAIRQETVKALNTPLAEAGSIISLVVIALVASWAGVDAAVIITSVLLLFRLQPHLRELDTCRLELAGLNAALTAVREMIDRNKPYAREGAEQFQSLTQDLRFQDVSFSHVSGRKLALDRVSFTIRKGETVILSGESGSGKTTLLNMMLRLYDPDSGMILVDGVDLHSYTRASWLAQMAVAGQDVELIEGTVAQNLTIGVQHADRNRLREICEMVEILEDIDALPNGFEAPIGAAGKSFSGGQRQRIGLARALMRSPKFLILDEAMSALEPDRELRIFNRISDMMAGGTVVIVSHRNPETYRPDRIIHVAKSKITSESVLTGCAAPDTAFG